MEKISRDMKTFYKPKGLFEYLLVIAPGKEVYDNVMEEKEHFARNYQHPAAIQSRPHIIVSNFLAWDTMEEAIIAGLQRIMKQQRSFEVILNNYSGFPSHTVFIRVQDPMPFKDLASRLQVIGPYIKQPDSPPARFMQYPNISIARQLPAAVYEKAIKDYSGKDFHASFRVNELLLLKRQNQFELCKETGVFRLQPNEYNEKINIYDTRD